MSARAILFDFDNTLHDQAAAYRQTIETAVAPHCAPGVTVEDVMSRCHAAWAELWTAYVCLRIDEVQLYGAWFDRMRAATGGQATVQALRAAYEAAEDAALQLYPDVLPALAAARALRPDVRLAVVTNGAARRQRARLEALGLTKEIPVHIISGAVGIAKPDAGIFARALSDLGVRAAEAVMIGDSPEADVAGARRAGLGAVWLNRGGQATWPEGLTPGPDAVAADLGEAVRAALGAGRAAGAHAAGALSADRGQGAQRGADAGPGRGPESGAGTGRTRGPHTGPTASQGTGGGPLPDPRSGWAPEA